MPLDASAQVTPTTQGVIEGSVSLRDADVRLSGADVTVEDATGTEVARRLSDADGRFRIVGLSDGRYRIIGTLEGFRTTDVSVTISAGGTAVADIRLPIAAMAERVDVVASATLAGRDTLAATDTITGKENEQYSAGGGFQAALRLLASVVQAPSGMSIKGGRPNQASIQLGAGSLVDPSTGNIALELPADAIDSVEVLPNPYTVEFGRFSSGLVVIQTRRATDKWQVRLNNLDPGFRTRRDNNFKIVGLGVFAPRLDTGGPLVDGKLFLRQTAQYRYTATEIASRSQDEVRVDKWLSTFTRLDANAPAGHALVVSGGLFPRQADHATLGTFTPPEAAADLDERIAHGAFIDRAAWTDTIFSESTVRVQQHRTEVEPRGPGAMRLLPETTSGHFFNDQRRTSSSYQWVTTVAATRDGVGGLHLLKLGVDLLHSRYEGFSASKPVLVAASDGRLVRRLDFHGPSMQRVASTDIALFAQDRIAPNRRWSIELGGRLDRDGVLDRLNATPRAGVALVVTESGSAVVRGGYGLFYERTPSVAGAYDRFETWRDTRFDAFGNGQATEFARRLAAGLRTARSATWNVTYDHRLNRSWSIHGGLLDRRGAHELVVNPVNLANAANLAELLLHSDGRSTYREAEASVHYTHADKVDLHASYVRSVARGDLNSFTAFFGPVLAPIVGANAHGRLPSDVPHRLLARGRLSPTPRWLVLGVADWRTGFPYSRVDERLDFVGPRNRDRFPNAFRVELGLERRFKIGKLEPWIGVRANNAFKAFLPADVQANIASPSFGSFYNSEIRQLRLLVRFSQ